MRIAIGCDHGGFILKAAVVDKLKELGHEVVDFGTNSDASVDYPIYGEAVFRLPQTRSKVSVRQSLTTFSARKLARSTTTRTLSQWAAG